MGTSEKFCWVLAEQDDAYFRSIIYFTHFSSFAVIVRERKVTNVNYEFVDSTVIPKKFLTLLTQLKTTTPSEHLAHVWNVHLKELPAYLKNLFYKADYDAIPISDNQQVYFQHVEEISSLWGIDYSPQLPYPTANPFHDETTQIETPVNCKKRAAEDETTSTLSPTITLFDDFTTPAMNQETPGTSNCLAPKKSKLDF